MGRTGRIKGVPVTLYEKTLTGYDEANRPVYTETPVTVDNVLIGEPSTEDITSATFSETQAGRLPVEAVTAAPSGPHSQAT